MFIDLNCFLSRAMWPMGLLLSSYIKQLLHQCVKLFQQFILVLLNLQCPRLFICHLTVNHKGITSILSNTTNGSVNTQTECSSLYSVFTRKLFALFYYFGINGYISPLVIHMIGCFLVMEQLKTVRGNEVAAEPVSYTHLTLPTICSV